MANPQIQAPRRYVAATPAMRASGGSNITREIKKYVNAEPFHYYDTQYFAAAASTTGNVLTLATFPASGSLPFFNARTISNSSEAYTSMSDVNKFENDFRCHCISVDVFMDADAAAAAGIANAGAFVETVVNYSSLKLSFGTDVKLLMQTSKCPSGGGVVQAAKVRTQTAAATSDSAHATNGLQTAQARRMLDEPIFFRNGQQFSLALIFTANAVTRIAALQALTSTFQAGIRVNLEGIRGKPLLQGTPVNR